MNETARSQPTPLSDAMPVGAPSPRAWLGGLVALGSAMAFALNVSLVPLAYEAGANVHAVNLIRPAFFALCLLAFLLTTGSRLLLPLPTLVASLGLGALLGLEMYFLLAAIAHIPVGLTVLIMYTYPILVALLARLSGTEVLDRSSILIMLAVFAGLGLALRAPVGVLNPTGIGFAVLTAVSFACLVFFSERTLRGHDNRAVMLWMMIGATTFVGVIVAAFAEPAFPAGRAGWFALVGATLFFVVATFLLFTAIRMIGPLTTAAIDNTSPVWAILFAFLLVGEGMTPLQLIGVTVVLGGVIAFQVKRHQATLTVS